MSEKYHNCAQIKKKYNCDGELEKAVHVAITTTNYVPPTGIDLEYRIQQYIEDAKHAVKVDRGKKMKADEKEIAEKIKNG